MREVSNPLDHLIELCEQAVDYGTITKFTILNAKDELKRLRNNSDFNIVCWARINSRGDLYDPRLVFNPHLDESTILPLYCNKKEFQEKYGKLSK